ncbi:hypothetical protein L211DRAFT_321382 [Terfezia boudieri ATCC MYA-4762]|uniref:Uncharacterized protein n=1 Tax=Terfezia boudieri ATCC MYA-4762 TaxID=1051890 RepID=A0A3N4LXE9_9PEZI|nr:hypothetical protein L211DRAFT_321382 [Terfezia boudieri ATCC MYA-4762]
MRSLLRCCRSDSEYTFIRWVWLCSISIHIHAPTLPHPLPKSVRLHCLTALPLVLFMNGELSTCLLRLDRVHTQSLSLHPSSSPPTAHWQSNG